MIPHPHHIPDRGLDHLVLCVNDLDEAAKRYEALGFKITPQGDHDWGTSNRLAQLEGSFLEILTVTRPERIFEHGGRRFSFGAFNRDFLEKREGFAMTVFESHDVKRDRDQFAERGLPDLDNFSFERQAVQPDGQSVTVGFSMAFAPVAGNSEMAFFTCQQHAPEYFWKPDYQSHPNGARSLEEVAILADEPAALRELLESLQDAEAVEECEGGLLCHTARGRLRVYDDAAYRDWYGEGRAADAGKDPYFAGYRVGVSDLEGLAARLEDAGIDSHWARAGLVVPAASLFGTSLAFAQI